MERDTGPVWEWGALIDLQRSSGTALHEQLEHALRELIRDGRLGPDTKLPSSRALATTLQLSRGVVLEAYAQLVAEGYLTASQGAPTRVARAASAERPPLPATSVADAGVRELLPDVPALALFPRERWLRSLRTAMREAPFRALGEPDPRGAPMLRNTLMEYLSRARAAAPEPEHLLVSTGFTQAFSGLCRSLAARGVQEIALESPGWPMHRMIAEQAGLTPLPVAVDEHGLSVAALSDSGCEVVVVTPAHQYPTGVVLGAERRAELLEWAEEVDGLIVEDDYDSELRYDRVPVGALQGLAPERVCHIGSASKRLAPGLRIGWTLSPSWLTGVLTYEHAVAGVGVPVLDQLAFADFVARGELDRHLRRMRAHYGGLREALLTALGQGIPGATVSGIAAGLFVAVSVPIDESRRAAVSALELGTLLEPHPGAPDELSVLLGFADRSVRAIADGVAALGRAASG